MRHVMLIGSIGLACVAAAIACSSPESFDATADGGDEGGAVADEDSGTSVDNTMNGSDAGSTKTNVDAGPLGKAGTGQYTGLNCDVQAVLENRCIACHDGTMVNAPPLLNYADLIAASKTGAGLTLAQEAVVRMQLTGSLAMPPPPAVGPDPEEIAAWGGWIEAGAPENPVSCTDPPPDGGTTMDGGTTDGGDAGTTTCTSMKYWDGGNTPSQDMNPGEACMACHQVKGGPNLSFGGTIYKAANEPDLCFGQAPPPILTVTVTDKQGRAISVYASDDGNFQIPPQTPALKAPFKAKLTNGTTTRAMVGAVTSGDCNSCHTQAGKNGAPGRILAP